MRCITEWSATELFESCVLQDVIRDESFSYYSTSDALRCPQRLCNHESAQNDTLTQAYV